MARRLELADHVYGYVACRPGHHHHLACSRCGRVEEIGEGYVRAGGRAPGSARPGFVIDDARLDFYGRCARACRGRRAQLSEACSDAAHATAPAGVSPAVGASVDSAPAASRSGRSAARRWGRAAR